MKKHLVVALAYDGLCTFEFGSAVEVFATTRPELDVDWYRFAVCTQHRQPVLAKGGFSVLASHTYAMLARADTIIIPGWSDINHPPPADLIKRLQSAHRRGARIAAICTGAFVLAAAGLLDGRQATTHWRYASDLQQRFSDIDVQANALYVDQGQVITSAGSAAGLDMLLHLVRLDHGDSVAKQVAQRLVIAPHRLGDQAQFVARSADNDEAYRLSQLLDWLQANLGAVHSTASIAQRTSMSVRTLQRQFQDSTGLSPIKWLNRERIAAAQEVLETSTKSVGQVAAHCGFGSEESFRKHFRSLTGTSPTAYRAQFRAQLHSVAATKG